MRNYQKAGFNYQEAEKYFEKEAELKKLNPPIIYRALTLEEKNYEEKRDLIRNIERLFILIDKAYNNNNNLINVGSFEENWNGNYK